MLRALYSRAVQRAGRLQLQFRPNAAKAEAPVVQTVVGLAENIHQLQSCSSRESSTFRQPDAGATSPWGHLLQLAAAAIFVGQASCAGDEEEDSDDEVDVENGVIVSEKHPIHTWIIQQAGTVVKLKPKGDRSQWPDFIKPAPNPTLLGADGDFSLAGCKAVFWDPVAFWGDAAKAACATCVVCDEREEVHRDGPGKIRKVCGLTDTYFIVAPKYRHKQCKGGKLLKSGGRGASTWTALHETVVQRLPAFIQLQLPVTFTRRGAVDRDVIDRLTDSILNGGSFTAAAEGIREAFKRRDLRFRQQQLQHDLFRRKQSAGQLPALLRQPEPSAPSEPDVSRAGNASKHMDVSIHFQPSRQYLSAVWLEAMRPSIDWSTRYLSTVKGRFWCMDHTFATAKCVRDANQQQLYKAVLTVMNEHCQVVAQWFTHTTSLLEVRSGLEKLKARYKDEPVQGPEYIWVDNSDQSSNILHGIFPSVKKVLEDSTHLMRRYMRTLTPGHPMNQDFVSDLSKAFFMLHEPDRQALKSNLSKSKTEEEIKQLPYRYWKERCRRTIPEAGDITPALEAMMKKTWVDEAGCSLVTDATTDAHKAALRIINSGRLSDPLPVEEMYYNRSKDVSKPEWITVRGSSKLEGYHPHFHSVLPGTGYAPDTAGGTLTLFNAKWTVKRGIQNKGEPDTGTAEPWMQYNLAQLSAKLGLPTEEFSSIRVPSSTDEKFGVDFVPDNLDWLEAEKAEREGRAEVEPELSEEDERLLAANTLDALRFLDDSPTVASTRHLRSAAGVRPGGRGASASPGGASSPPVASPRRLRSSPRGAPEPDEAGPSASPTAAPIGGGRKRKLPESMAATQPAKSARGQSEAALRRSPRQQRQQVDAVVSTTMAQCYTKSTMRVGYKTAFPTTGVIGKPCRICSAPIKEDDDIWRPCTCGKRVDFNKCCNDFGKNWVHRTCFQAEPSQDTGLAAAELDGGISEPADALLALASPPPAAAQPASPLLLTSIPHHVATQRTEGPLDQVLRDASTAEVPPSPESAGKKKLRSPRRSLKPVDVASPVQTDGEVALFFSLHSDSSLKNRDGSDNFVNMAAQFNTAFHKQFGEESPKGLHHSPPADELEYSSSPKRLDCQQVVARQQGQYVAPNQQIRLTNPQKLMEFRDSVSARARHVAATAVSAAANSMQQLSSSAVAAGAAEARLQRMLKLREQKMKQQGSQAGAVAAAITAEMAKPTQRGGKGTVKKCSACRLHKTRGTGHTGTTCPTHCLKCKQPWQTADKFCSCQ